MQNEKSSSHGKVTHGTSRRMDSKLDLGAFEIRLSLGEWDLKVLTLLILCSLDMVKRREERKKEGLLQG